MSESTQPASASATPDNWESLVEPIAWRPSEEYLQRSRLLRFMRRHNISDYATLLERANDDLSWFWDAVSDDLGLVWQRPYTKVMDTSRGEPWTRWYVDGQFNYVATALDQHAEGASATRTALIWEGEDGDVRRYTYAELQALTTPKLFMASQDDTRFVGAVQQMYDLSSDPKQLHIFPGKYHGDSILTAPDTGGEAMALVEAFLRTNAPPA